jgi:hypothetical protein
MNTLRCSTTRNAVNFSATIVVMASLSGCATNPTKRDFYAARSISLSPDVGDGTVIVRHEAADLLTRERQALALSRHD